MANYELGNLVWRVTGDTKQYDKSLKTSEKKTKSFSAKSIAMFAGMAAAAIGAYKKISATIKESIGLYGKQIDAESSLRAAIEASGQEVDSVFSKYTSLASEIQRVTTVGDEATIEMMSMATAMGIADGEMEMAIKGAIGLSDAFGMGTQQAIRGVANALNGEFTTLQRYIPALRTATTDSEKMALVQEAMAGGFEVSKSKADSAFGALQQLDNATGDLKETLGQAVAEGIAPFVTGLTDWVTGITEARTEILDLRAILEDKAAGETLSIQEQLRLQESKVGKLRTQLDLQSKIQGGEDSILGSFKQSTEELESRVRAEEAILGSLMRRVQEQNNLNEAESQGVDNQDDTIDYMEDLTDAYSKTKQGRIDAIRGQIAYFETFKSGPMAIAVLENLRNKLAELTKGGTEDLRDALEEENELRSVSSNEALNAAQEDEEEEEESLKEHLERMAEEWIGYYNTIAGLASAGLNNRMMGLENEAEAVRQSSDQQLQIIETQHQRELELAGLAEESALEKAERLLESKRDTATAEELIDLENAVRKAEIDQEYADKKKAVEKETALALWEIQVEEFEAQKKLDMIQAAITTAQMAMNAYKSLSGIPFVGPILGAAAAAVAVGYGLKQQSLIANQPSPPKPAFARGGEFITDGRQEIVVGDNPGGRERVSVEPLSSPNVNGPGGMMQIEINLDGRLLAANVAKYVNNGKVRLEIAR